MDCEKILRELDYLITLLSNNIEIRYSDDCWECVSHKPDNYGYPRITRKGIQYRVYRYVYEKVKDKIPKGKVVRHTCDNRLCINPDHLILGSVKDNIKDKVKRNRTKYGEQHHKSKLTKDDVLKIKKSIDSGCSIQQLAIVNNVSESTIRRIKNKQTWKRVLKNA